MIEAFKYVFSRPGALTAAINYYRNMFKIREKLVNSKSGKVEKPVLIIWVWKNILYLATYVIIMAMVFQGDDDHVLTKEMADNHDSVTLNLIVK